MHLKVIATQEGKQRWKEGGSQSSGAGFTQLAFPMTQVGLAFVALLYLLPLRQGADPRALQGIWWDQYRFAKLFFENFLYC